MSLMELVNTMVYGAMCLVVMIQVDVNDEQDIEIWNHAWDALQTYDLAVENEQRTWGKFKWFLVGPFVVLPLYFAKLFWTIFRFQRASEEDAAVKMMEILRLEE